LAINNNLPVASGRTCIVNGTLDCGISTAVTGAGTFTLANAAMLIMGSPSGITTSAATGNVQTTTCTLYPNADYVYNGLSEQVTGNRLTNSIRDLTINNSSGVSLSSSVSINGQLILSDGGFSIGGNTITFQNANIPIVKTTGTIATNTNSNLVFGTTGNTAGAAFVIPSGCFTTAPIINNLTINRVNSLTLNEQEMSLKGVLLCNGPLTTGGNLLLLSTTDQTALIDGTGTGNITGNVTMQRYLPSGFGYKYVSSPFQASTVNELADDLDLAASFPALYAYDEDNHRDSSGTLIYSTGWVKYITGTDQLLPLKGYAAYFGNSSSAKTIDMTGVVNNNISSTQTLYNHNRQYTKGFNLAGNPYPSPIDWDASTGWTKTNIDNAIYYFDAGSTNQYTGIYSSYILGMSSNGLASNVIPSMQGFFVHVTDGTTGTFGMDNQVRINNLSPLFHKSAYIEYRPMIRLTAAYENEKNSDPTVVYFNDIATAEFDKEFDALKLMNTDVSVPNLYALTPQSVKTSISAIPYPTESETRAPLGLKTEKDNWITLMASNIENIPGGIRVYLTDEATGLIQDLQLNPEYRVNLERGTFENRFALLFSEKDMVHLPKNADTFHASILNGKLTIFAELALGNEARLVISNLLGQVMLQQSIYGDGSHEIGQYLPTGMYVLSLYTQKGICSKKIYIPN
jgi:hypothetical protein